MVNLQCLVPRAQQIFCIDWFDWTMRRNGKFGAVRMAKCDMACSRLSPFKIICPGDRFQAVAPPVMRIVSHLFQDFIRPALGNMMPNIVSGIKKVLFVGLVVLFFPTIKEPI
jgi:hypothetical protein